MNEQANSLVHLSNPTDALDVRFSEYIRYRKSLTESHLEGGIPNYAYGNDYMLRQKIKTIPGAYKLAKAMANYIVPLQKQQLNLQSLKVGPDQFPDVYQMVVDCARILGIGIPTTFVMHDNQINAFAYATEDDSPLIVITSGLIERFTPGETKYVIGHECSHVHNNHVIFNIAAAIILDTGMIGGILAFPGLAQLIQLASLPLQLGLQAWSRAAEVTSDRGGIICADSPSDMITATAKFLYGGTLNRSDINIDALLKQYEQMRGTPVRLLELSATHPVPIRRIFAAKEFMNSEVLFKWRPEWRQPGMNLINKQELDMRCDKIISVTKGEKKRGRR
jgi:Zn-dependent protease with chaperone function